MNLFNLTPTPNEKPTIPVASELNISVKTVSTYRTRLTEKMGMHTNAELIAYAVKNNIC